MLPVPPNFVFSLVAIPVFGWETVESPGESAPAAATATCESNGSGVPQEAATSAPARRLVFKGYEWHPAARTVLYPEASWENCFAAGAGQTREDAERASAARRAQENELALREAALAASQRADGARDAADAAAKANPTDTK